MSRLLLEICPDDAAVNGAALELPPILICAHEGQDAIAFEGTLGGKPVVLRFKDGAYALENPTDAKKSVMGLGEWHVAEGWKLRVTQGISTDSNVSVAMEDPSWAEPEIHVTTFNGTQTKRFRSVLPNAEGSELVAGRDASNAALVIEDEHVSRAHLRFFVQNGKRLVEDLGSRWGTKLNGQPLTDARQLKHGDELRLGKTCINYVSYMDIVPDAPAEQEKPDLPALEARAGRSPLNHDDAKPIARPGAAGVAPTRLDAPGPGKPQGGATAITKPGRIPAPAKPQKPGARVEVKPPKAGTAAANPVDKPAPNPAAAPGAPEAAKKAPDPGNAAPAVAALQSPKPVIAPQPAPPVTAPGAKTAPVVPDQSKSSALLVLGAALVILLTFAGVAYLGYELFLRKH